MQQLPKVGLLAVSMALICHTYSPLQPIQSSIGFAILGYLLSDYLIPATAPYFIKIGLFGKDLSKKDKPVIPETIGIIPAVVYLFIMFSFIPFMFFKFLVVDTSGGGSRDTGVDLETADSNYFPHNKLSSYLSGVLSLESMVLLGLLDDLFDIRWRHKFFLPAIAAIPLLIVYYVDFGVTHILIPTFIKNIFGFEAVSIDLGALYYGYMGAVAIFCPNSINILAGINGLEVGQSVVLAVLLLLNDFCYLIPASLRSTPAYETHLMSTCILVPFLGVSLSLLKFNWYPAKVFVGDTFCYFSGMVFAFVGISGHFSKTLLLFFLPQIFNFVYSIPQLFGLVECPRHRLPRFNQEDNMMYPSHAVFKKRLPKLIEKGMLILEALGLLEVVEEEMKNDNGTEIVIKECSNFTLINLVLVWFGPMREDKLCFVILLLQFSIGLISLVARHTIAALLFGYDNLSIFNLSILSSN
ncbi:BA75_02427T0 [Komagataella pastoris]|uniref:UDP-N-acetylglucosamine--dolichyl-phosphate N-acetylglucosaminephosphotransferase n=1 Tax=Komagataella pastoris TaxID=4922 RepID=A0A1B2JBG1_PICPA|nr:BA75_02427T0 [Komagataella pastoris]